MEKPKRCLFADVMDPGRCQIISLGNWFQEDERVLNSTVRFMKKKYCIVMLPSCIRNSRLHWMRDAFPAPCTSSNGKRSQDRFQSVHNRIFFMHLYASLNLCLQSGTAPTSEDFFSIHGMQKQILSHTDDPVRWGPRLH